MNGTLLKFLVNYLKDRKQCVIIGGSKSGFKNVRSGVPQGSILGPLLFVLYINDMSDCIHEGTNIALYADDTKIWRRIVTWSDHEVLQSDINALQNWAEMNKMKFHPDKCKVLSISNKNTEKSDWSMFPFQVFIYTLGEFELDYCSQEKDLGTIVTNDLTWEAQINALCSRASSRLGLMKRTLYFIKNPKQKRVFYLALTRSLFEHNCIVWRPLTSQLTVKVESIQKRAVKWILNELDHHYNNYEYFNRLRDLDLMPMSYKLDYTDLVFFHSIFHGSSVISLPPYITPMSINERHRLRSNVLPPDRLGSAGITASGLRNHNELRNNRCDELSLRSTVEKRAHSFGTSFFFRTHSRWNDLPMSLKNEFRNDVFQTNLKKYFWEFVIEPD